MSKITERNPTQMLRIYGNVFQPLLFNIVCNTISFVLPLRISNCIIMLYVIYSVIMTTLFSFVLNKQFV